MHETSQCKTQVGSIETVQMHMLTDTIPCLNTIFCDQGRQETRYSNQQHLIAFLTKNGNVLIEPITLATINIKQ